MKTFRAHSSFIPKSISENPAYESVVILPKTDYEILDTNQAFGIYIKLSTLNKNTQDKVNKVYVSPEEIEKYGDVLQKLTISDVKKILNSITFAPSCVDFNWKWEVVEVRGESLKSNGDLNPSEICGFLINTTFQRPDTNTGIIGVGRGRRMWIEETASETSIVMTAWLCAELIVKHELMEAYLYDKAKILNPHKTLEELAYPEKIK